MKPTQTDIANQTNMATFLQGRGWFIEEIGNPHYPADYLASKQGYQALVEYKRRFFPVSKYPTFQMFARKYSQVRCMAREWQIQPVLIVQWDDCIAHANLFDIPPVIVMGGRRDRGRLEIEPCVDIPLAYFKQIK